ncbi:hypothetical protein G7Z17_g1037 [Cylindrodendrum hubeiense]|uniref:Aminotransferase class I/classII large domain-containing protein n=1 Tax=Cylindrodendrum hubeiense TaxID=595255 RepID=A0A9P5HGQ0_9HYPO|nr:hypothetical protein G7Z17_g1037 [Cylindrodendrum hubeiense]
MSTIETVAAHLGVPTSYLTARNVLGLFAISLLVYQLLKAIYNISPLHPLSHIPGRRLAAATYLPEFYYDVIKFGRYTTEIRQLHEEYGETANHGRHMHVLTVAGPIVRINPHEVHCSDANFADEIYAVSGRKRDKPVHQINGSASGITGFGTADHDLHRIRRTPLAKFFSRGMISRLESEIQALVQTLCDRLLAHSGHEPFDVTMAYSCFTSDAISGYCFGESFGFLNQKGWYPNFREPTASILRPVFIFRFFPWTKSFTVLGRLFINYLPENVALFIRTLRIDLPNKINKIKSDMAAGIRYERPTVFGSLLESDLELSEKNTTRLTAEASAVVGAGTETTSWALAIITYHLLTKPELLEKLTAELNNVVSDPKALPTWTVLEKLPYLGAVLQEGLRLSYGVSGRTARVPTEENLVYRGEFNKKPIEYIIPRGYAVGMSAVITHHDESVFPNSFDFIPERWLDEENQRRKDVERGMLAFSKGNSPMASFTMVHITPFAVERWMGKYELIPNIINIAETCAASVSIDDLINFSQDPQLKPLDAGRKLTYGDVPGSHELRERVAAHCSDETTKLSADDVLISQGAIAANFLAMYTLIGPGDHVICIYPTYQQLYDAPRSLGAEVSLWRLREEDGFLPSIQDLKDLIKENTKMIIINNPNNPTGILIPTSTLQEIANIAKEKNIILFSDEVYRPLFHGGTSGQIEVPVPATALDYERTIVTGSMSKGFALAGLRLGWIATRDKGIMEALTSARDYTTICVSQLDDQVASYALSPAVQPSLMKRNITLAQTNARILKDFVERYNAVCSWVEPKAGTTAFIRFSKNGNPVDDVEFCKDVVEKTKVYFCPGSHCFGRDEDFKGYVRVGYVGETDVLIEGLEKLGGYIERYLI